MKFRRTLPRERCGRKEPKGINISLLKAALKKWELKNEIRDESQWGEAKARRLNDQSGSI